ncbi:MAG TPA: UDP-N-acetylmuramate dehydrogenase [Candidatus Omnitrophota bacterium]|nr:UDP-N-acetylmuramate dehydrogenase [Candidatus Omnitrophota bacterium]HPD85370.1 UDP-N-acetylmuramate dehydrogenase [Candidatus Omnitrophota bacterium]HRZ04129.1 UDP-N-acetylmuramate dehydrogenase [Candidatus Omnitrophota bacterium]
MDSLFTKINIPSILDAQAKLIIGAPLCDYTTFQLGGFCPCLIECQTPIQLKSVISALAKEKMDFLLIGGGSNLLVSDQGIDQIVIRYLSDIPAIEHTGDELAVTGSTLLDHLAIFAAENGLEGLGFASGIYGTVGGAIVGNAGAFGKQIGDSLKSVVLMDRLGNTREVKADQMGFSYRHSNLKETGEVVVSARFKLKVFAPEGLLKERQEILETRRQKHPDVKTYPSAGSFFRNIEPTSSAGRRQAAGWFLEQAGAKEMRANGAAVFEKHANIIIKAGTCTSQDVFDLAVRMKQAVKEKFGFDLIREVRLVGTFNGMPASVREVIW